MQLQYFRTVSDNGIFGLESGDIHSGRAWVRVCAYEWMCVAAERNGEGEGGIGWVWSTWEPDGFRWHKEDLGQITSAKIMNVELFDRRCVYHISKIEIKVCNQGDDSHSVTLTTTAVNPWYAGPKVTTNPLPGHTSYPPNEITLQQLRLVHWPFLRSHVRPSCDASGKFE